MNYERRSGKNRRHATTRRLRVDSGRYNGPEKRGAVDRRQTDDRRRKEKTVPIDFAVS